MIQHKIFTSSLRKNGSNSAQNHNGDWGGTGGKFGVFGQSRTNRSLTSQQKSRSHEWENRVRSSYRKTRTQIGRSNLRKQNKDNEINRNIYALVSPPRTAPVRRLRPQFLTSPILSKPRSHTSHGKREKSKKAVVKKLYGSSQAKAREICRLEPPESPRKTNANRLDHPIFTSPSKSEMQFFETMTSPPPKEIVIARSKDDHVRELIRSESAPCLASKNRFLTTSASKFELRSPSKRSGIMSPGRKDRIRKNQNRIKNYVEKRRAKTLLQDTNNVESKKALRASYQKKVDALEEYHFKQEKRKENMWGLT